MVQPAGGRRRLHIITIATVVLSCSLIYPNDNICDAYSFLRPGGILGRIHRLSASSTSTSAGPGRHKSLHTPQVLRPPNIFVRHPLTNKTVDCPIPDLIMPNASHWVQLQLQMQVKVKARTISRGSPPLHSRKMETRRASLRALF